MSASSTGHPTGVETHLDLGPDAEAFRDEVRSWLADNRPDELVGVDLERAMFGDVPRHAGVDGQAPRGRLPLRGLAQGVRRPRPHRHRGVGAQRRVRPRRRAPGDPGHGRVAGRPVDHRVGHRRAEGLLPAADHRRHRPLLPGLLRARRRLRPGVAQDPRRRRRRRGRHHRPEGVDLRGDHRQHDVLPVPHRSGRAQAPGHLLRAHADEAARRRRTTGSSCGRSASPPAARTSPRRSSPTPGRRCST